MTDTTADDLVTVDSFRVLPEAEAASYASSESDQAS